MPILILIVAIACLIVIAMIPDDQAKLLPPPVQLVRLGVRLCLKVIFVIVGLGIVAGLITLGVDWYKERVSREEETQIESPNNSYSAATIYSTDTAQDSNTYPTATEFEAFKKNKKRELLGSWSLSDESEYPYDQGVFTFKKNGKFIKNDGTSGNWELVTNCNYLSFYDCEYTLYIHYKNSSKIYNTKVFDEKILSGQVKENSISRNFIFIKRQNIEPQASEQANLDTLTVGIN